MYFIQRMNHPIMPNTPTRALHSLKLFGCSNGIMSNSISQSFLYSLLITLLAEDTVHPYIGG
jgi:hypothetical protein